MNISDTTSASKGQLINALVTGTRTLAVIQIASIVDFWILSSLVDFEPVGDTFFYLFFVCQMLMILALTVSGAAVPAASVGLQLLFIFGGLALALSVFQTIRVFTAHPYTWVEALFVVYYFVLNAVVTAFAGFVRYVYPPGVWDAAVDAFVDIGSAFVAAYSDASADIELRAALYSAAEILVPFEAVTLFVYFVAIGELGQDNYNFTGWVFALHFFGILVAIVWLAQTASYRARTKLQQDLDIGIREPPSVQPVASVYALLFVLEGCQLVYASGFDHPQLVVLRAFLCVAAGIYVVISVAVGLKYYTLPRPIQLVYGIQHILPVFATLEAFWLITYFCVAQALDFDPVFWNLVHALTLAVAFATAMVSSKPLSALAALGICASVVCCVDIIIVGRVSSLGRTGAEIFVQVVFLVVSIGYIITAAALWSGSSDDDVADYFRLLVRQRLTADKLVETVAVSYVSESRLKTEENVEVWREAAALRIRYIIGSPIKIVFVIELVFVVLYTAIIAQKQSEGGANDPEWYQWFYLLHFISAAAALLTVSMELSPHTALLFLVIMAVVNIIADSFLMGYLAGIVSAGEIAIQSFFFGIDILYLVFFILVVHRSDSVVFGILITMRTLEERLISDYTSIQAAKTGDESKIS